MFDGVHNTPCFSKYFLLKLNDIKNKRNNNLVPEFSVSIIGKNHLQLLYSTEVKGKYMS